KTNVPGIEITELLPNLAKMADKFTLVRSLFHNRNEHSGGTGRMFCGHACVAGQHATGAARVFIAVVEQAAHERKLVGHLGQVGKELRYLNTGNVGLDRLELTPILRRGV